MLRSDSYLQMKPGGVAACEGNGYTNSYTHTWELPSVITALYSAVPRNN